VRAGLTAIALAALWTGAGVAADPSSTKTDVIAVATNANGGRDTDIALVTPEGRVLRFLTQNGLDEFDPSWSPDRRRIAFARAGARRGGIHMINVAGRSVRRLTFAPDGRTLAFLGLRNERFYRDPEAWGVFLANADGTNVRKVYTGKYGPTAWSPDGTRLAVQFGHEISVVEVAGGVRTTLFSRGRNDHAAFRP
jgi:Tol biopolymer transport system component